MQAYDQDVAGGVAEIRRASSVTAEKGAFQHEAPASSSSDGEEVEPTEEEMRTLRRVSGKIPWIAYTVTFVEFAERFSYYGTTAVFVNFIQQERASYTNEQGELVVSRTGAGIFSQDCYDAVGASACQQAGALGQGQRASTGLVTFNQFWAYCMPLLGGYIADTYLGRYMTIQYAIIAAVVGHIILIVSSIPSVISSPDTSLGIFALALVIFGMGTGGFKSNISPLLAEQIEQKRPVVITLKSGERVIKDPAVTISRIFLYFYMMINLGSLAGGIGMVYAEQRIGFWLAFALPTFVFFLAPIVLIVCKPKYKLSPPTGSVLGRSMKLLKLASTGCWSASPVTTYRNFKRHDFWDRVKPSHLGSSAPAWMSAIDDQWVDQVARGLNACKVFFWMPLYWLAYNQMTGNLTSQSATLQLNGTPNDLINNLNPITLVVFIPVFDHVVYPTLRKMHIHFTPIKRITMGFFVACMAMISACVLQYYIYMMSDCPDNHVNEGTWEGTDCTAPINVWVQALPYCLIAFSEIGASISTLEYAYSKAPENMRGLVMGVNLFSTAISAAIGQALVPLAEDPLLIWNYGVVALIAFFGGIAFWFTWRGLDSKEDEMNLIPDSAYKGRRASIQDGEKV